MPNPTGSSGSWPSKSSFASGSKSTSHADVVNYREVEEKIRLSIVVDRPSSVRLPVTIIFSTAFIPSYRWDRVRLIDRCDAPLPSPCRGFRRLANVGRDTATRSVPVESVSCVTMEHWCTTKVRSCYFGADLVLDSFLSFFSLGLNC